MDVRLPDGTIIKGVPDGMSKADLTAKLQANGYDVSKLTPAPAQPTEAPVEKSVLQNVGQFAGNVAAGALRGAGSIGATLIRPFESAEENAARRQSMDQALASMGAEPDSYGYAGGKFAAEMAGTAGVGGAIAKPVQLAARYAPRLVPTASALAGSGLTATSTGGRLAAGAATGAAGAGLIDPDSAATGAAVGAVVPFAAPVIQKVVGKIADMRQIPLNRVSNVARGALGADLDQTVNALRSAPPNASVAEVTAKIQNPTWQTLVKDSLENTPGGAQYLNKFAQMSHDEGVNALSKLAGGTTATDVRATTEVAKKNVNAVTGPVRESALTRANLGKEVTRLEGLSADLGEQAAAKVQEVRRLMELGDIATASARLNLIKRNLPVGLTKYTYSGELAERAFNEWSNKAAQASLDLGQGARFADEAAGALRSVGIKPLEGQPLVRSLKSVSQNPEFAGNDVLLGALKNVGDDIAKWTDSGGVIDARALDAIRKNSVNAAIQQLRPGMDATSQRNLAAGVLGRVKPVIDDAIESAGGSGYREYLKQHAQLSQKIAEKQLTGEALRLWKSDKDAFVRLVQNESPDAVEKVLGPGKYNIATELAESTLSTLQAQAEKHLAQLAASKQAETGHKALTTLLQQNAFRFRLPSWLSFAGAAINKTISELERAIGDKSMRILSDAMQSPQKAADLLESLPATERSRVLRLIGDPSKWSTPARAAVSGGTAAGVNMLAPERNVENELVR